MISEENEKLLNIVLENLHKSTLAIPVLKDYRVFPETTDAIFIARSKEKSVEQYLEDGQLEEGETFEERLINVLQLTKETMIKYGFENRNLQYLGTFVTELFKFTLYLQDNVKDGKQVRQINAYFLEPESKYFYEITLSAPPMYEKDVNDIVTHNIYSRLRVILANIKYNETCPI